LWKKVFLYTFEEVGPSSLALLGQSWKYKITDVVIIEIVLRDILIR